MKNIFKGMVWSVFIFALFVVFSQACIASGGYCTDDYSVANTTGQQNASCASRETEIECLADPYYHLSKVTICKWVASNNTVPTVTSPTVSSITATSAKLGANVESLGIPAAVSSRGVCYSDTSQFPSSLCKAASGTTTGVFSVNVSSLTPNTLYYYRGYATNTTGTGYSPVSTFTPTGPLPDLIASNPHYTGAVPLYNSGVNLEATITNMGDASTGTVFHNVFWVSNSPDGTNAVSWDDYTGESGVGPLGPNDEGLGTLQTSTDGVTIGDPNDTYIQACADHSGTNQNYAPMSGVIVESNESNNCSAWVPLIPPTPTANLTLQSGYGNDGNGKDLVDANNTADTGTSYLKAVISNIGFCTLYRNGAADTISPWGGDVSQNNIPVNNINTTGDLFSLHCNNGINYGNVTIHGQSGTLSTSSTSCTIPKGGSSCSIKSTWATTNSQTNVTTWFNGGVPATSGNSGTNVDVVINGSGVINNNATSGTTTLATYNKVDGETSGTSEDNKLASSSTLTISCESGSAWNGSICDATQTQLPDLTSSMTEDSYGAFVSQPKNYTANITNVGSINTTASFYNLFQVATASGSSGGGSGVSYQKDEGSLFKNFFKKISKAEADSINYTVIQNVKIGPMNGLNVGETKQSTASISISSEGTYYIRACADKESQGSSGSVPESNENNNCSNWVPVSVTPVPPVPAPDLTAYSPSLSSGIGSNQLLTYTTTIGKTLTFYSTISNIGSLTTGKSFQNSFQIMSDLTQYIATPNPMPMLGVGVTATASKSITFSNAGTYKIRACADIPPANPGAVLESNENNNCSGYTTVIVSEPSYSNLRILSGITPTDAVAGVSTTFNATIINSGAAVAISSNGKGFYNLLQWYDNNDLLQTIHNVTSSDLISTPLGIGETAVLSRAVTFSTSGSYMVRVCADKNTVGDTNGLVSESNEDDNCSTPWTLIRVAKEGTTAGEIQAADCAIMGGYDSCDSNITWNIYNPIPGADTAVTTPVGQPVANGNSGSTTFPVKYSDNPRTFYLYHNGIKIGQDDANAFCVSGTKWDGDRNACVDSTDPIDGGWTSWICGECSVDCGGGTQACTRSCTDPVPANGGSDCEGPSETSQTCNSQLCTEYCTNGAINYPDCDLCSDGSIPNPNCPDISGSGDVTLKAVPSWIFKGRYSTLTWESWPRASCKISPDNVEVADSGSKQVYPSSSTVYNISCIDGEGTSGTAEATVRVIRPIIFEN